MGDNLIIPFGKYAGQPVEVLQADPSYCNWLASQDWFRERYANINTLIINNFTKPEDTPEHNALQAKFLNEEIVCRLITLIEKPNPQALKRLYEQRYSKCLNNLCKQREYLGDMPEKDKFLSVACVRNSGMNRNYHYFDEKAMWNCDVWINPETPLCNCGLFANDPDSGLGEAFCESIEFEVNGWDVYICGGIVGGYPNSCSDLDSSYFIEIKPSLGDDYPSVLRQMKANAKQCHYRDKMILVYKEFTASGATLEQVKTIFESSKIIVFSLNEL